MAAAQGVAFWDHADHLRSLLMPAAMVSFAAAVELLDEVDGR